MAKVEGPQEIPSELLDGYRATMGEIRPDDGVRKRYPYRVPPMQTKVGHPSTKQKKQRDRFNLAIDLFKTISEADRERWYAAMPPWESFLWYYNYFILSALMGDAYTKGGSVGVIKSLQYVKEEVPTTGGKAFAISEVDPAKTVVMMFGNSFISDKIQRGFDTIADGGTNNHALSPNVDPDISEVIIRGMGGKGNPADGGTDMDWAAPYVSALIAAQLTVKMVDVEQGFTCGYSWEVIEHKAQTIYPIILSIGAEVVNIDWAKAPTVPADISLIVIEYI